MRIENPSDDYQIEGHSGILIETSKSETNDTAQKVNFQLKDAVIEDEGLSENTPLHQKLETQDSTIEMTESLVPNGQSEMEHEVLSPSVNEMSNEVVEELPIEESEKPSEESETTSPVSIFDMPLVSIVEEDDFVVGGSSDGEESEESEDEPGVSIQFLINSPEPSVSNEEFEQVFESDVTLESPSQEQSASPEDLLRH